jgi:hypothetical protein
MLERATFIALGVVLAVSLKAGAQGDVYTNRSAWQAAIAGQGVQSRYDFEVSSGFPTAPAQLTSFDGGRVTLISEDEKATLAAFPAGSGNQVLSGHLVEGDTPLPSRPLRMTFNPPLVAMGFDILELMPEGTEVAIISVTGPGRAPTHFYPVSDGDGVPETPVFFGLALAGPIAEVDIYAEDPRCDQPVPCYMPNAIDDLDVLVVPEPAAGGLLLALALLASRFRRGRGWEPNAERTI